MGKQWKQWQTLFSWASKSLQLVTAAMKKILAPWKKSYDQPRQHMKKQRHYFANKVHLVKAVVFPVVMYRCESWTINKAECQRIDAFELWCWRRLLRVPWTARRPNQSILNKINPEYSLEGLMLKLKLQYFDHLMRRADSLEKTLMLGKIEGRRRRGRQRIRWLDGITNSMYLKRKLRPLSPNTPFALDNMKCTSAVKILCQRTGWSAGESEPRLICPISTTIRASLVAQMVINLPAMQETWVWSLSQEDPWKREWQPTSVFLPGEYHRPEEPGRLQSMGSQRFRHDWATNTFTTISQALLHALYNLIFMSPWVLLPWFIRWGDKDSESLRRYSTQLEVATSPFSHSLKLVSQHIVLSSWLLWRSTVSSSLL